MTVTLSKNAIKQISKIETKTRNAIFAYLENLNGKPLNYFFEHGALELKGNLKGLIRFKDKSFSEYRLVGIKSGDAIIIILCCEPQRSVYKNKAALAKCARKQN